MVLNSGPIIRVPTPLSDTAPSTQAHSDSAAAGTGTSSSRDDHKHAMPAAGASGPSQANQAALEAETNEDTYAPPDLIKHSPGVAKAYCRISSAGALLTADYNVASVTDTGTGDRTIVWTTDFANDDYAAVCSGQEADNARVGSFGTFAVGSVRLTIYDFRDQTISDMGTSNIAFGDQ